MRDEIEHTCQFCYYEYFDSRAYPCSMCVCGEERKDMFQPKGRENKRKTENSSEIPNNCEWSVEYAKEMLDTMSCEECGHWEHGAGDHYYCALLEMRQECCFESKGESTLMFANKPKDEPTISKMEQVETMSCQECKHFHENAVMYLDQCDFCFKDCKYEPKDEPQTEEEILREQCRAFMGIVEQMERSK